MKEEIPSAVTTTTTVINTSYDANKDHALSSAISVHSKDSVAVSSTTTTSTAKSVVLDLHANPEVSCERRNGRIWKERKQKADYKCSKCEEEKRREGEKREKRRREEKRR